MDAIDIGPADLHDLNLFPLRWRWTDKRYSVFSEDQLSRIRPLRSERALGVFQLAQKSFSAVPNAFDTDERLFEPGDRIDSESPDVGQWLASRIPADVPVIVLWDKEHAVLTDSGLFLAQWDDFCYPSSDDVSVLPLDGSWILHFSHEEKFLYARRRLDT